MALISRKSDILFTEFETSIDPFAPSRLPGIGEGQTMPACFKLTWT